LTTKRKEQVNKRSKEERRKNTAARNAQPNGNKDVLYKKTNCNGTEKPENGAKIESEENKKPGFVTAMPGVKSPTAKRGQVPRREKQRD